MDNEELLKILAQGEDSQHQWKKNFTSADAIAAELTAFANSKGGMLIIGIDDKTGLISGLTLDDVSRLNALFSNASSQHVKPPLNPLSCNISLNSITILAVLSDSDLIVFLL